jgi:hypothetical protein
MDYRPFANESPDAKNAKGCSGKSRFKPYPSDRNPYI